MPPAAATVRRPAPLASVPAALWRPVRGVLTDIDDTLTRDGAIEPAALAALGRLAAAGVPVIAITGRPMGWSRPFAAAWPVRGIVAENGAVLLVAEGPDLRTEYVQDEPTRQANVQRLQQAARRILAAVPGATLSRDSAGRVTDIAIDHAEHARLDDARVAQVVEIMRAEGMNATVSSIHVNGWYGSHDKLSGARWAVQRLLGRSLDSEMDRWIYVGDSTNDQAMFGAFALSVGVANLMHFAGQLHTWPAFITTGERGTGFAEVAQALLTAR
jgi:HAD superfamily hydrolase (TIGR01484 family)